MARVFSHPIHPMLISFPLALWVTSLCFDQLGRWLAAPALNAVGFYTGVGGCIGALLAAVPGALDWYAVIPPKSSAKKKGLLHGALNVTVLVLFTAMLIRRGGASEAPDNVSLGISLLAVAILSYSGWLGGTLVFRNQIGVDHRYANAGQWKERSIAGWEHPVCNTGELGEGQMMLAKIAGERVVIARCPDGMSAFSDHCTHSGGPLSDGALVGCTVQCPWHGSQFDVKTGRVVAGPATSKIQTYEIEVRKNEVYVKPQKKEVV